MEKITIIDDFKHTIHFSFTNFYQSQYRGIINCPEHELHGKPIWKIVETPRNKSGNLGKAKVMFYVSDNKKGFKDLNEMLEHYKLPPLGETLSLIKPNL